VTIPDPAEYEGKAVIDQSGMETTATTCYWKAVGEKWQGYFQVTPGSSGLKPGDATLKLEDGRTGSIRVTDAPPETGAGTFVGVGRPPE
jgi:hypothetical protein